MYDATKQLKHVATKQLALQLRLMLFKMPVTIDSTVKYSLSK